MTKTEWDQLVIDAQLGSEESKAISKIFEMLEAAGIKPVATPVVAPTPEPIATQPDEPAAA